MPTNDYVSIHDWKPSTKPVAFRAKSLWRTEQNKRTEENIPGKDDLLKIKAYIENNVSDKDIMDTFNISSYTLKKIKLGIYNLFGEGYMTPTKKQFYELADSLKDEIKILYQNIKDDFRIENNLSEQMFQTILIDVLGLQKKKWHEKKPKKEEVLQTEASEEDEDSEEASLDEIEVSPEELRAIEIEEVMKNATC